MGSPLPELTLDAYKSSLQKHGSGEGRAALTAVVFQRLWTHYQELRQWNPRLSLIGPGTAEEAPTRHYLESLTALSWVEPTDQHLLDVGSGGGFPGWVLAAAEACPQVTLVEPRQRKWSFLRAATRRARLSCRILDAKVSDPLPAVIAELPQFDIVTIRALTVTSDIVEPILRHSPTARFWLWVGQRQVHLPAGLVESRSLSLTGSDHRRIIEATLPDHVRP